MKSRNNMKRSKAAISTLIQKTDMNSTALHTQRGKESYLGFQREEKSLNPRTIFQLPTFIRLFLNFFFRFFG